MLTHYTRKFRPAYHCLLVWLALLWLPVVQAQPTLLVLGDSLSAGYGIALEQSWVSLLAQHIRTDYPNSSVINASISGETSGGGLRRLPPLLQQHQPDLVLLELGANDGLRGLPIATLQANLTEIIRLSRSAGAKVLLFGMHIPPNYGRRYTEQFAALYGQLSASQNVALVPFLLEGVAGNPVLIQADGLHPTAAAQPQILANSLHHILPLLRGPHSHE